MKKAKIYKPTKTAMQSGLAKTKLWLLEFETKNMDINQLFVEASIIAKPLFEKFGFTVLHENKVVRNNVILVNFTMHLPL